MIGIDSSALIDLFRGDESVKNVILQLNDELILNMVSYLELMFGIDFKTRKNMNEEIFFDSLFNSARVLDLSFSASKRASLIMSELESKGAVIEPFDCVIAGIYLASGINKIITRNVKHFTRIPGVEVIGY